MSHIVKRAGHTEPYDPKKLYASVYAAALSVREPAGTAELIAKELVQVINEWMRSKHEVTSNDIRRVASRRLVVISPDTGYMYQHHRNYS